MNMKKTKTGVLLLILAALIFGMGSCDLFFGMSIPERIDAFNDDVAAGNLSRLYTHFHSDAEDLYDMRTDPSGYWGTTVFNSTDALIGSYSVNGDTVTGTIYGNPVIVQMKKDGLDYMILSISYNGEIIAKTVESISP